MKISDLPLELLDEPANPHRNHIDSGQLAELAASIQAQGLWTPLVVTPTSGGRHEVRAGHRRLLACRLIRLSPIPCIIAQGDAATLEAITWLENQHREQLSIYDEAIALQRQHTDAKLTTAQLARMTGRSHAWVSARLAIFTWPADLVEEIRAGGLSLSHASALARVHEPEHRVYLTNYAKISGANAHVIEAWVQQWEAAQLPGATHPPDLPPMTSTVHSPRIIIRCETCDAETEIALSRVLRVCPGCAATITQ